MGSILILGAGPAGSFSALCLARRGHHVTVIEEGGITRAGANVRHARQGHSFLALGTRHLMNECPEVFQSLLDQGAHRILLAHDSSHCNLLMRRSLLDIAFRKTLSVEPRIQFLTDCKALGLRLRSGKSAGSMRIAGIETNLGRFEADVVVDASGAFSPVPRWLSSAGLELKVTKHANQFIYITRSYLLKQRRTFPSIRVPILVDLDYLTALAFPEDNRNFQLSIQVDHTDPLWRALRDPEVFDKILWELPAMAAWLDAGDPVADPEVFASRGNSWSSMVSGNPLVRGLFLLGDACAYTNPTAGRGVSLALAHARALAQLLDSQPLASWTLAKTIDSWERGTAELIGPWYESQVSIDEASQRKFRACLLGVTAPHSSPRLTSFASAFSTLRDCEVVGAAGDRLLNLLATPQVVFSDRMVLRRLMRSAPPPPGHVGPDRKRFEALVQRKAVPVIGNPKIYSR